MYCRKLLPVLLLPLIICCNGDKKCQPQIITTGVISNDRIYNNPQLGISVFVPEGWTFIRNTADSITIDKVFDPADERNSIVNLFTMTVGMMGNPEPFSRTDGDFSYDYALAFNLCLSDTQDAEQDVEKIKSAVAKRYGSHEGFLKLNEESMRSYSSLSFGETNVRCFNITTMTHSGKVLHKGFAIKNYGFYNLMILLEYSTEEQLQMINNVLSKIKTVDH